MRQRSEEIGDFSENNVIARADVKNGRKIDAMKDFSDNGVIAREGAKNEHRPTQSHLIGNDRDF